MTVVLETFRATNIVCNTNLIILWKIIVIKVIIKYSFSAGTFFHGVDINNIYTRNHQTERIAQITGIKTHISDTNYLSRGHLAAMADFVFATGQLSSFRYINVAPQWQRINDGNWNTLEQVNAMFT